jgi:hypothetical protein
LESSGYLEALEDNDTDASMSSEEEEAAPPPSCGPLQAALLGSFETVHREASTRAVHAITLKLTIAAIASHVAEISVEFSAKEAVTKKLMAVERKPPGSSKRRWCATQATPPGRHTGDSVERRPKWHQRQRGLQRRRLGRRR